MISLLRNSIGYIHTITSDNRKEFAFHKKIAQELGVDYYFARPYQSWERGANENSNGLVRQFSHKGSIFERITQEDVDIATDNLNNRSRKDFFP